MINGLIVVRPPTFRDSRGAVLQMLRADAPHYAGFGEIYFSVVNPGVFKGWKRHREMTLALTVPSGRVLLVIYDDRAESSTKGNVEEIDLSPDDHKLIIVPPLLWSGFTGLADTPSVVANCASILHRPDEADNLAPTDAAIPFRWPR